MIQKALAEFEKRSRDLVAKVEDRVERAKVEREAQKRVAELKREAQQAARAVSPAAKTQQSSARPVRVVREGKVVGTEDVTPVEEEYRAARATRAIKVGDRVRLRSFGSIGIVDKINNDEAEVRVKALRFREKLVNLELVEAIEPQPDDRTPGENASLCARHGSPTQFIFSRSARRTQRHRAHNGRSR